MMHGRGQRRQQHYAFCMTGVRSDKGGTEKFTHKKIK